MASRPDAGGGREVPNDRSALLTQIEAMCESWLRWETELHRAPDGGGPAPASALPKELLGAIKEVGEAIGRLRARAERALVRGVPGRRKRHVPDDAARTRRSKSSSKT